MLSEFGGNVKKYQDTIEEFLQKMSFSDTSVEVEKEVVTDNKGVAIIRANIQTNEPQILIGQSGQTLFSLQKLLYVILIKKYQENIRLEIDINHYKEKKEYYLKKTAQDAANQVVQSQEKKSLPPMSSYERRIVHAVLAERNDVVTESHDDNEQRYIIISPK